MKNSGLKLKIVLLLHSYNMQLELHAAKKKYEAVRESLRSIVFLNVYQIISLTKTILMHQISKKMHQMYFYQNSKNLRICIELDFLTLIITLSQFTNLINVSFRFQLDNLISGVNI